MAVLLIAIATCAVSCGLLWVTAVVGGAGKRPTESPDEQQAAPVRTHEEDRVRPAVDPMTGERIWLAEDDAFWHEIVTWPPRRTPSRPTGDHDRPERRVG